MPLSCSLLDADLLQTTVLAFLRRCQDAPPDCPASLLLLDIDQLSPDAQAELLAFFRVPTFGLRTIVTARQSLMTLAKEEKFLRDLALALSIQVVELPSLADRRQDIPFLAQQLLEEYNERGGRQFSGFAPEAAVEYINRYHSPEPMPNPKGMAPISRARFAIDDIKAFYFEAALAKGIPPSSFQLNEWFWKQTLAVSW